MKVNVFAILKDYFDPSFNVNEKLVSIKEVKNKLVQINPQSENILKVCRFAVNDELVSEDHKISDHDVISVLPPASGG
jgi:molybdopterin converting factor small subunit